MLVSYLLENSKDLPREGVEAVMSYIFLYITPQRRKRILQNGN